MKPNPKMFWTDGRGNRVEREVNQVIDVRDCLGMPGFPLLIMAANPHLSLSEVVRYLDDVAETSGAPVRRTRSWANRRRWLWRRPNDKAAGNLGDRDGMQTRAIQLMTANRELSIRDLALLLKDHGIERNREWVRKHRCDSGG